MLMIQNADNNDNDNKGALLLLGGAACLTLLFWYRLTRFLRVVFFCAEDRHRLLHDSPLGITIAAAINTIYYV